MKSVCEVGGTYQISLLTFIVQGYAIILIFLMVMVGKKDKNEEDDMKNLAHAFE